MRLLIPYKAVSSLDSKELIVQQPGRCSHCNAEPAKRFETHRLVIKADKIPNRQIGIKYRVQQPLILRLPLCETCYLKGYLTFPDAYANDANPLGAHSRRMQKLTNTAGILAGVGLLLLTPFIPPAGVLSVIKSYWYVLLGAGILLLGIAWGLQRKSQAGVRRELEELNADSKQYPRADAWSDPINGKIDPSATAVSIIMENENWMNECACLNNWRFED